MVRAIEVNRKQFNLWLLVVLCNLMSIAWLSLAHYSDASMKVLALLLIFDSVLLIVEYHRNVALFVLSFFIGYCNYSIAVCIYLDYNLRPPLFSQISDNEVYGIGLICMVIFSIIMLFPNISIRKDYVDTYDEVKLNEAYNPLIEVICYFAFLIIFFTQTSWQIGSRMSFNALAEYRYLFVIIASSYSKKSKFSVTMWNLAIVITTIISVLGGSRVDAIPNLLLLILIWYPNIKVRLLLIGTPLAVLILKISGSLRGAFSESENIISNAISSILSEKLTSDTFPYGYLPSLCSIDLSVSETKSSKFSLLIKNIKYIFLGGSAGKDTLSGYTRNFYAHSYGYIAPTTFYYWFGYLGVIIFAIFIAYLVRKTEQVDWVNDRRSLKYVILLCFVVTVPRWYVYNVLQFFRAIIFIVILHCTFRIIDQMSSKAYF